MDIGLYRGILLWPLGKSVYQIHVMWACENYRQLRWATVSLKDGRPMFRTVIGSLTAILITNGAVLVLMRADVFGM